MEMLHPAALPELGLWAGINLLLMLVLALNVTRLRFAQAAERISEGVLERGVRAHGNDIEYVPMALIAMTLLCLMGFGAAWMHGLGATLFLARLLHAHGIQQEGPGLPKSRVLGNVLTWGVFLICGCALVYQFFAGK